MKRIYAAFERVENARAAVGRVKKESWNRAGLVVILPGEPITANDNHYEFGDEHFLDTPYSRKNTVWPVLQDKEVDGIGIVKIAVSLKPDADSSLSEESVVTNKEIIAEDLKNNKVITIIEAEDEIVSQIEIILESEGAEITIID